MAERKVDKCIYCERTLDEYNSIITEAYLQLHDLDDDPKLYQITSCLHCGGEMYKEMAEKEKEKNKWK